MTGKGTPVAPDMAQGTSSGVGGATRRSKISAGVIRSAPLVIASMARSAVSRKIAEVTPPVDLDDPLQRAFAKFGRRPQRQCAQQAAHQALKIGVVTPRRQAERIEATVQMSIPPNGFARFVRAKANERNTQLVAEEAQKVEHAPLLPIAAGHQILHLVDHQHPRIDFLEQK